MAKKSKIRWDSEKGVKAQKRKRRLKITLAVFGSILALILIVATVGAVITSIGNKANLETAKAYEAVKIENQLVPVADEDDCYTFVTDGEFTVMQITDIHIGAGYMSLAKDEKAMNTIANMVREKKPDLVIATGDVAYPVPFQAGTLNNLNGAKLFAQLMESLGVYWTLTFGNHDTEAYSYYSREDISQYYNNLKNEGFKYCIYTPGPENVDGFGNQLIKVKNSAGKITQSLFLFDSHSYTGGDILGLMWKYDNIKESQVNWYKTNVEEMTAKNTAAGAGTETVSSLAFFHIPLEEYKTAWEALAANDYNDTQDVKYHYGMAGEVGKVIYSGIGEDELFETMLETGSTKGIFCGHDHYNNFSIDYKGIRLTYSPSVDFLAYAGISKLGSQRGCTLITLDRQGNFDCKALNYYKDFEAGKGTETEMQFEDVIYQYIEE